MRSRMEAGFAAYLDSLPGVMWAYEPECFANEHGQYLPDFRIDAGLAIGTAVGGNGGALILPTYVETKPTIDVIGWEGQLERLTTQMAAIWDTVANSILLLLFLKDDPGEHTPHLIEGHGYGGMVGLPGVGWQWGGLTVCRNCEATRIVSGPLAWPCPGECSLQYPTEEKTLPNYRRFVS